MKKNFFALMIAWGFGIGFAPAWALPAPTFENQDRYEKSNFAYVLECDGQLISSARHRWTKMGFQFPSDQGSFLGAVKWAKEKVSKLPGGRDRTLEYDLDAAYSKINSVDWVEMQIIGSSLGLPAKMDGCTPLPIWADVKTPGSSFGHVYGRAELLARMSPLDLVLVSLPEKDRMSTSSLPAAFSGNWAGLPFGMLQSLLSQQPDFKFTIAGGTAQDCRLTSASAAAPLICDHLEMKDSFGLKDSIPFSQLDQASAEIDAAGFVRSFSVQEGPIRICERLASKSHEQCSENFLFDFRGESAARIYYDREGVAVVIPGNVSPLLASRLKLPAAVKFSSAKDPDIFQIIKFDDYTQYELSGPRLVSADSRGSTKVARIQARRYADAAGDEKHRICPGEPFQMESIRFGGFFLAQGKVGKSSCSGTVEYRYYDFDGKILRSLKPSKGHTMHGELVMVSAPPERSTYVHPRYGVREVIPYLQFSYDGDSRDCSFNANSLVVPAGCTVYALLIEEASL